MTDEELRHLRILFASPNGLALANLSNLRLDRRIIDRFVIRGYAKVERVQYPLSGDVLAVFLTQSGQNICKLEFAAQVFAPTREARARVPKGWKVIK